MKNLIESINNNLNESVEEDLNQIGNENNMYADIVNTLKNNITDFSDRNEVRSYLDDLVDNEEGLIKAGFKLDSFIETYKDDVRNYINQLNYYKQEAIIKELMKAYNNTEIILQERPDNYYLSLLILSEIINDINNSI